MVLRAPRTDTHTTGNLGFAKAVNLGLRLVETPYATLCNDDVEFVDRRWWSGVQQAFGQAAAGPGKPAAIVTPMSIKIPYWAIGRSPGDDYEVLPYRREWSEEDWQFLTEASHVVNERLTLRPHRLGVGAELFCSVLDMSAYRRIGPLNERFYPAGGEDYDYTRRAALHGFSCASTTDAWVYHHWGASMQLVRTTPASHDAKLRWNDLNSLWSAEARTGGGIPPVTVRTL